jgi:hypothetical protein
MNALHTFCATLAFVASGGAVLAQDQHQHDHGPKPAESSQKHDPSAHPPGHEATPEQASPEHDPNAHPPGHGMTMNMTGNLGGYPMARDASGTSWQPDSTEHAMGHEMSGDWMLMGHVLLNGVYDWQDGPRGDEKAFVNGMIMGVARRSFDSGSVLNLRAMLSPDPFMGKSGYPLLLAAGETADGLTPLVDRQHPHDLFMELSASFSHPISATESVFVYAGYPGEPAFGPPAFMHRASIMDSPEAPITHHWFDSTHITFGVLTAGWVHETWKAEVSVFTGREPDEARYNFDEPRFDSPSVRISWNPDANWALQVSWADLNSVEGLEPEVDETRWSASAIYNVPLADGGSWATTLILGAREPSEGESQFAVALESAYSPDRDWTIFGRGELIETNELGAGGHHGPIETVGKISLGVVRDFDVSENVRLGIGGLYSFNFVPDSLEPSYGGDPDGAMVFLRLAVSS